MCLVSKCNSLKGSLCDLTAANVTHFYLKVKSLAGDLSCAYYLFCLYTYIRYIILGGLRIVPSFKKVDHQPADGVELLKDGWGRVCTWNLGKVISR